MRWMALIVVAAACSKGSKKDEGSPEKRSGPQQIKGCDPAKPFTEQQALAWYRTTGGEKYEEGDYGFSEAGHGITELGASPCCDRGYIELGVFYNCKVYSGVLAALHDVLLARGWDKADPAKRVELAKEIDPLLGQSLATQPKTWNPHVAFAPPTVEAKPDGSVKLRRWVKDPNCGGQGCDPEFVLRETVIGVDPTIKTENLESFREQEGGYADPKALASCDPTKPPAKEYVHAVYMKHNGDQAKVDKLVLVDRGRDLWALQQPGWDNGALETIRYFRRCKESFQLYDFMDELIADAGWAKADAAGREKIALEIVELIHPSLMTKPADWDDKYPFAPPKATSTPSGGVTVTRVIQHLPYDGNIDGDQWTYSREEKNFKPSGELDAGRQFEHWQTTRK